MAGHILCAGNFFHLTLTGIALTYSEAGDRLWDWFKSLGENPGRRVRWGFAGNRRLIWIRVRFLESFFQISTDG